MIKDYFPILIQAIVAIGFVAVTLILSVVLGKAGRKTPTKDIPYECGMIPEGKSQPRFSVKFYLVAMLFILFDIEIVFMYPWAVVFREFVAAHGPMILWSMLGFAGVLTIGYIYALKKGVLDWRK